MLESKNRDLTNLVLKLMLESKDKYELSSENLIKLAIDTMTKLHFNPEYQTMHIALLKDFAENLKKIDYPLLRKNIDPFDYDHLDEGYILAKINYSTINSIKIKMIWKLGIIFTDDKSILEWQYQIFIYDVIINDKSVLIDKENINMDFKLLKDIKQIIDELNRIADSDINKLLSISNGCYCGTIDDFEW